MTFIWHLRVDFKYLIREVDNKVLHLVKKKKGFYPYECE